jgi:hypothetical protein
MKTAQYAFVVALIAAQAGCSLGAPVPPQHAPSALELIGASREESLTNAGECGPGFLKLCATDIGGDVSCACSERAEIMRTLNGTVVR